MISKLILAGFATVICLLFSEGALRMVMKPVNFLLPELIDAPVLGERVKPGSAGRDA